MNGIAFFAGLALVAIGLVVWLVRPASKPGKNTVKAFGMEFSFDTPAFVVMGLGIVMMYMSTSFPYLSPGPYAAPSSSALPAVQIPNYSTGWIDGAGKSTPDYCDPQKAAYEHKYPRAVSPNVDSCGIPILREC